MCISLNIDRTGKYDYNADNREVLTIMKNETQTKIFTEAKRLFEEKGYYETTVREICKVAGGNTGLFHYYFKNKYKLGVRIYDDMFNNIKNYAEENFAHIKNPAVFMGIMMRMHTYTINDEKTIKFSIDALKEGIFESSMLDKSRQLLRNIDLYYETGMTDDQLQILLTTTLGVEHALITQNHIGTFRLGTKEIADRILRVHLFGYSLEHDEIETCVKEVHKNFKQVLDKEPNFVCDMIDCVQ